MLIGAAGVDAGGVDRVAGKDVQHGCNDAGELSLKLMRNEVVRLSGSGPVRSPACRPMAGSFYSVRVRAGVIARHGVAGKVARVIVDRAVRFLEFKAHIRAVQSALQGYILSTIDRAGELALVDLQFHALAEVVSEDD